MPKYDKALGFWFDKSSKMWCTYLPKLVKKKLLTIHMYEYAMPEFGKTAALAFDTVENVLYAKSTKLVKKSLT